MCVRQPASGEYEGSDLKRLVPYGNLEASGHQVAPCGGLWGGASAEGKKYVMRKQEKSGT